MSKKAKPQGDNAALKHRIERAEAIVSALVADVEAIKQRLAKVEKAFDETTHPMMHYENGKITEVAPDGFDKAIADILARLAKVETAVAGPQTPDVAGTTFESQMPETE